MTTINYSAEYNVAAGYVKVEWPGMAEGDVGQPFECAGLRIASVHTWGTFSGGTVTVQGSNKITPGDYQELYQIAGATIYDPSTDEKTQFIATVRPIVTGGSGNSVGVAILLPLA